MPKNKHVDELTGIICSAIDVYRLTMHDNLTVGEILAAIERIRFGLTERVLKNERAH